MSLKFLKPLIYLIYLYNSNCGFALPVPSIKNLAARYDNRSKSIFIDWIFDGNPQGVSYTVRYQIVNRPDADSHWKQSRTNLNHLRLDLPNLRHGDEIHAQVRAERGGHVIEDWSQTLIISVSRRLLVDNLSVDDNGFLPPLDFTAIILSPSSVRLEWTPNNPNVEGLHYIINVKQLTSKTGEPLFQRQIKVVANNFALGNLKPGEHYEMTIRTALSPEQMSDTAAIVEITMPKDDEYFEVGNLVISSHFQSSGQGIVNLTWDVPPHIQRKIKSYDVEYKEMNDNNWQKLQFIGQIPSATLKNLKSGTEYLLKIKTTLHGDVSTESGHFKFRTPEVLMNPINKVDVIYTNEMDSVRLHWVLEPSIIAINEVFGYDVYLTEDKDLPESQWKYLYSSENSVSVNALKSGTTYYIKINVRKTDGTVVRSPSIYRFKTMEYPNLMEMAKASVLEYQNIGFGRVNVSWTYPWNIRSYVIGSTVYYTDRQELPLQQWNRMDIYNADQNFVVLNNLKRSTRHYIRIVPKTRANVNINYPVEIFDIIAEDDNRNYNQSLNYRERNFLHEFRENGLTLKSCDPTLFKRICGTTDRCVRINNGSNRGWCVPEVLIKSILVS